MHEIKPPIVNQKRAMDKFQCDLRDASYVGCTLRHLHQRVAEISNSLLPLANTSLRNIIKEHCIVPKEMRSPFSILKRRMNKFDCLMHEMLLIRGLHHLSMSTRTQFKQNYLRDIAYVTTKYVNLERIFWQFIFLHLNLKMVSRCHRNVFLSYR